MNSRENIEVINGFYSPLEKVIAESKQDKLPSKQWIDKFARGEEAKWTSLTEWLSEQQGSVSKSEILEFLSENRIEIEEIVKDGASEDEIDIFLNDEAGEGYTREEARDYLENDDIEGRRKYSQYQLAGEKENYKEILITMPNVKNLGDKAYKEYKKYYDSLIEKYGESGRLSKKITKEEEYNLSKFNRKVQGNKVFFRSSHWDEPNIIVHLRLNTRIDTEGDKVLFIEEIQSDWGEIGRKEGFLEDIFIKSIPQYNGFYAAFDKKGRKILLKYKGERIEYLKTKEMVLEALKENPPLGIIDSAPFVTDTNDWVKLGLKVALKEAVSQGCDKIAWATGEQENDRYSLEKQVDEISYLETKEKGIYDVKATKDRKEVFADGKMDLKKIEATLGKDIAKKISNGDGEVNRGITFITGKDLKVGGKGMIGFYGSTSEGKLGIIGNVAKSLFKQEPQKIYIATKEPNIITFKEYLSLYHDIYTEPSKWDSENVNELEELKKDYEDKKKEHLSTQYSIDITPELEQKVKTGLELFREGGNVGNVGTFSPIGYVKSYGVRPTNRSHDMIAECDCKGAFTFNSQKRHKMWECPCCNELKKMNHK